MKAVTRCLLSDILNSLFIMRNWLFIIFSFSLIACSEKTEKAVRPLEFYFDFREEVMRLESENPAVKKTVTKNGKSETITDTIQWKNELALFIGSDINKPQFKDSYEREILENDSGKIIKYTARENDLPVRIVELSFNGNEVSGIYILKEVNNFITKSRYELSYFPFKGYTISGRQSVPFFYEEDFLIEGVFMSPENGKWRAALRVKKNINKRPPDTPLSQAEEEIPFEFNLGNKNGKYYVEILNAEEKITCNEVSLKGDSISIRLPVFDSEIKGKFVSDTLITGAWYNYSKGSDYIVPFYAEYGKPYRFKVQAAAEAIPDISGKWSAEFSPGKKGSYAAIGVFRQNGTEVSGTFLTETGDYRYLEGTVTNNQLLLSCFNGSQAFLFRADLIPAGLNRELKLQGTFNSGIHFEEPWIAVKDEKAKLANPDSLTFLKPGFDKLSFSFPDLDSHLVSLSDKKFQNKVVIIQILGSWCPNCLDETVFLSEIYKKEREKGLEIIGLSFERSPEFSKARPAVQRFKEQLDAPYCFLIAGTASTSKANEALPMLNRVMSFPTAIFVDRTGKVRKIHTGFYGPGTGEYYIEFKEETTEFIDRLLAE